MREKNYNLFGEEVPETDVNYILDAISNNNNLSNINTFITQKLDELKISQRQLCSALNIERKSLQRILSGEADKIDILFILKLSQFLGLDIKDLLKFYISGLNSFEAKSLEQAKKIGFIVENFDLDALKKVGMISSVSDFDFIENRIKEYFNFNSIFEYSSFVNAALFSKGRKKSSDKMLNLWLSTVNYQLKKIENPNVYDREKLLTVIPKLRICTSDVENGFNYFVKALYDCGITVIIESYLTKTDIFGGTFYINNKPCIVLTNYYRKYDRLWFTLAHEIYHVLYDLEIIKTQGYHISGQNDIFQDDYIEEQANSFARNLLLPEDKYKFVENFINIKDFVEECSVKWKIHPSIIYGFYMYNNSHEESNKIYYQYIPSTSKTLKNLEINPWQIKTIEETVKLFTKSLKNQN